MSYKRLWTKAVSFSSWREETLDWSLDREKNQKRNKIDYLIKWKKTPNKWRVSGICCSPHRTGKYGTRPFYGGSGCRAVAHTHPAGSKNALGPVGIPLLGRLRRRAINPTLPKEVKAWGEGPLRPKDNNKKCLPRDSQ